MDCSSGPALCHCVQVNQQTDLVKRLQRLKKLTGAAPSNTWVCCLSRNMEGMPRKMKIYPWTNGWLHPNRTEIYILFHVWPRPKNDDEPAGVGYSIFEQKRTPRHIHIHTHRHRHRHTHTCLEQLFDLLTWNVSDMQKTPTERTRWKNIYIYIKI